jgi:hypothetical protein
MYLFIHLFQQFTYFINWSTGELVELMYLMHVFYLLIYILCVQFLICKFT